MNKQNDKQPRQSQQGNKQDRDNKQQGQGQPGQKSNSNQDQDRQRMQSNIENPDQPDVKTDISDDPSETKKKIPNMQNRQ